MACYCDEEDVINKLLQQSEVEILERDGGIQVKSLYDELLEVGECVKTKNLKYDENASCMDDKLDNNVDIKYHRSVPDSCVVGVKRGGFELKSFLQDFILLSKVMDREIDSAKNRLVVAEEQKVARKLNVSSAKEDLLKNVEKESSGSAELEKYEKKIKSLKQALDRQNEVSKELQQEFNEALNEKEKEIENLMIQVNL